MTKQEYAEYETAVERFLCNTQVKDGCFSVDDSDPYFTWTPCDVCQRPLAGNREAGLFATTVGGTVCAEVCQDCVYYLTYGQLDDTTMLELAA